MKTHTEEKNRMPVQMQIARHGAYCHLDVIQMLSDTYSSWSPGYIITVQSVKVSRSRNSMLIKVSSFTLLSCVYNVRNCIKAPMANTLFYNTQYTIHSVTKT